MRAGLRAHRWLIATVSGYVLAAVIAVTAVGPPADLRLSLYFSKSSAIGIVAAAVAVGIGYLVHLLVVRRPQRPLTHLRRELTEEFFTRERLASGLLIALLLPPFISTFSSLKAMISVVHPFSLDPTFAALDRALHGGVDPWRLLHPILGRPSITSGVSFVYSSWFFAVFASLLWYAFSRRDLRLRMQFLLSFVGSWILIGTVAATALSSAGPCYFGMVANQPNPFAALMEYLYRVEETHAVWALTAQERLWELHESSTTGVGAGISAMPSVHVATAFLIALATRRTHRIAGIVAAVYFVLILVGSVHLGWHYAIDGYVGILGTWLVWWGVGRWLTSESATTRNPSSDWPSRSAVAS